MEEKPEPALGALMVIVLVGSLSIPLALSVLMRGVSGTLAAFALPGAVLLGGAYAAQWLSWVAGHRLDLAFRTAAVPGWIVAIEYLRWTRRPLTDLSGIVAPAKKDHAPGNWMPQFRRRPDLAVPGPLSGREALVTKTRARMAEEPQGA